MSFKVKLIVVLFILGIVPPSIISITGSRFAEQALVNRAFETLETANTLKVSLIEEYLNTLRNAIQLQATNPAIIDSTKILSQVFVDSAPLTSSERMARAERFFNQDFFTAWKKQQDQADQAQLLPVLSSLSNRTLWLQDRFIYNNQYPLGQKNLLISDGSGDAYDQAHTSIHPYLSNLLESFLFYDVFLIDTQGNIVYSVFKEIDFATSLFDGPFSNSVLAETYKKALTIAAGDIYISDYEAYFPSYGSPAGFIASPVFDNGQLIGVLAAQFPIDTLNLKMSNRVGLGESGDSFLVGKDRLLRSDSLSQNISRTVVASFANPEASKLHSEPVSLALKGESGVIINQSLDNARVLSAYRPINFANLGWIIVSEITLAETLAAVSTLKAISYASIILTLIISIGFVWYLLRLILLPLGAEPAQIKRIVDQIAEHKLDIVIPESTTGSVLSSMSNMRKQLKTAAEQEKMIAYRNQQEAQEKWLQAQKEAQRAEELLQIKQALDVTSTNIMIANAERKIIYMNNIMAQSLRQIEVELQQVLPHFAVDKILGSSIDIFHRAPQHQADLLNSLKHAHIANISIASMHFRLTASPIFNHERKRIGTVLEWLDRTAEVIAEKEIAQVVNAAVEGRFDLRITENNKVGFMQFMAQGLNKLTHITSSSLEEINDVLSAIAEGDITKRVNSDFQGRFEELKLGCNKTADKLAAMLAEIKIAAMTIHTAASEISKGNIDLSGRTEQQASRLEETASSMAQLSSTVRKNAANAKEANTMAANASTMAVDGGKLIGEVVETMASISDSAQRIADIISVIDGIAFQTNILALNAAVEAARAGEQGRGFAVVATEVRMLAQRSANAAKDIKSLIMDSLSRVNLGNQLVTRSGNRMHDIVTAIRGVNDIMSEIAAASSEQAAGLDEIGKAVSQMDEMTQRNAALVEEATAAAESLLSEAEQLAANVARFRIDDGHSQLESKLQVKTQLTSHTKINQKVAARPFSQLDAPEQDEWQSF